MTFAVLTHHKCASNWIIKYSRTVAQLNNLSVSATHQSNVTFNSNPDIGIVINAIYGVAQQLAPAGIHIIRNPLDLVCSAYFSHRDTHNVEGWGMMQLQRQLLQSTPKLEGMLMTVAALERADFDVQVVGPLIAIRQWDYNDVRFPTVRMEDAVLDVDATLGAAFRAHFGPDLILPDPADYVFEAFSNGRRRGEIDKTSHYRSGAPDIWREEMPQTAVKYVRLHMRSVLERFYPEALIDSPTPAAPSLAEAAFTA